MGRKRKGTKGLPIKRVYFKHGAYYFVDMNNKWHRIGTTSAEVYLFLSKLEQNPISQYSKMEDLFDRYMKEIAPLKAKKSFMNNCSEIKYLKSFFGKMQPRDVTPVHVYSYLDIRGKNAPVAANREKALLSHVLTTAIKWGAISINPCREVEKLKENRRDRYVTHEEFLAIRSYAKDHIRLIMDFAYITGLRKGDILKIKLADLGDEGIFIHVGKTKKKMLLEWTPELRELVKKIRLAPKKISSLYLFNSKNGSPYTADGFDSSWQRLITKALEKGIIKERFRFHDLRRKAATDAEKEGGRERARQLLGHSNQNMTDSYISGVRSVKPLSNILK